MQVIYTKHSRSTLDLVGPMWNSDIRLTPAFLAQDLLDEQMAPQPTTLDPSQAHEDSIHATLTPYPLGQPPYTPPRPV